MRVQAAPGLKVPREDDPRKYITDEEPVEIEVTGYYVRRLADGDLVEVAGEQSGPTGTVAKKTTAATK
jgi:hypothetical protein